MSTYRVADGFNVALGSLAVLSPQPASPGIEYTRQDFAADGTPINEGPFVELVWNTLGTKAQYQTILTAFGLLSADSNDVTVYVRNDVYDFVRMNGKAIKPNPGAGVQWQRPFPRNITILVRDLEAAS
jgi:hypothetical protein